LIIDLEKELDIKFEFVNLGWWIGIPYKLEQEKIDFKFLSKLIKDHYDNIITPNRKESLKIVMECGRMITWPYGYLVSEVLHVTEKYKKYVWLDASMQCLMRPALYWAYHHITILWKENENLSEIYDVTGSLCENNDKFAIDRKLPKIEEWDYIVIHDAWAHGTAMGFNYNAKLRPAELLLKEDWNIELIRRAETLKEYFATIVWINGFEY
jgi:diaminopimelate decarboxylase